MRRPGYQPPGATLLLAIASVQSTRETTMQSYLKFALLAGAIGMTAVARAEVTVPVHQATPQGPGAEVGTVSLADSKYGLVLTPDLKGLPPGVHGFHVHENGSCDAKEQAGKIGRASCRERAQRAGDASSKDTQAEHQRAQ